MYGSTSDPTATLVEREPRAIYAPAAGAFERRGEASLRLLTFTTLYPNAAQPIHGVFVENRLRQLVHTGEAHGTVIAPVPWFPSASPYFGPWARYASVPRREERHGIVVHHPRFVALPRLGMLLNPEAIYRAAAAALARLLDVGERFDAIDAHFLHPDGVAAVRLGRRFGLPVVLTARGSDTSVLPRYTIPRRRIQRAIATADAVVAVSMELKGALVALGAEADRVTVLRNGVDLALFRPPADRDAARVALGLHGPTLVSVGMLIERKGHHLTVAALRELPDYILLIVGEGPQRAHVAALAARLGVADRVRLMGAVPHEELHHVYGAADAMVLASSREGWANVLLESMACGTPVVASPAWGTREAVASPAAGMVLETVTPGTIADGVRRLLASPPDRSATRRYATAFGWEETTAGQSELFRRVVRAGGTADEGGNARPAAPGG